MIFYHSLKNWRCNAERDRSEPVLFQQESFESRYESLKTELTAERKVKMLQSRLGYANQELFGDRWHKVRKKYGHEDSDRPDSDRDLFL